MRLRIPLFLLLLFPLVEIAGFVIVGREIGVLPTIGLIIAAGIAGALLLRVQGLGIIGRMRADLEAGRSPGRELGHALMVVVAGILLIIPGFVSDLIGILLFLPFVRDRFLNLVQRSAFARSAAWRTSPSGFGPGKRGHGKVIDLEEDEFSANRDTPWRPIDRD